MKFKSILFLALCTILSSLHSMEGSFWETIENLDPRFSNEQTLSFQDIPLIQTTSTQNVTLQPAHNEPLPTQSQENNPNANLPEAKQMDGSFWDIVRNIDPSFGIEHNQSLQNISLIQAPSSQDAPLQPGHNEPLPAQSQEDDQKAPNQNPTTINPNDLHPATDASVLNTTTITTNLNTPIVVTDEGYDIVYITPEPVKRILCNTCRNKDYNTVEEILEHARNNHPKKKICSTCGCNFNSNAHLEQHINVAHRGMRYRCQYCGFDYKTKNSITKHVEKCGSPEEENPVGNTEFSCNKRSCFFTSKSINELRDHVTSEHPERKYFCEVCGGSYPQACILRKHQEKHV